MADEAKSPRAARLRVLARVVAPAALLLAADQLTKLWAVRALAGARSVSVAPGFFDLVLVRNFGCAWGMFQGSVLPLAIFALAAFALLVWKRAALFAESACARLAEPLLYAGILGNLADRFARGHVIDFLDFHWRAHHFPAFNVADSCITVAAALLILSSFLPKKKA